MNATTREVNKLLAILKDMLPMLKTQYHVHTLEVFGSFVRGDEREHSDLDLLVTFDEEPTLFKFVALENYLSDLRGSASNRNRWKAAGKILKDLRDTYSEIPW